MKLRTWCIRIGQILTKTGSVLHVALLLMLVVGFTKGVCAAQGITLRQQNASIEKIFQSIEKQTGYRFFYNETLIEGAVKVSLNLQNVSLQEALEASFKAQPFTYAIVEKTIIVKRRVVAQAANRAVLNKIIAVRGKVTANNKAVVDATVSVKGTSNATSTDNEGMFNLSEVDELGVLVVSHVNHQVREVSLKGQSFVSIDLDEKVGDLDEAVVVAYTTTTTRRNTGSVTVVKGEQIATLPNRSFDRSLQGLVPGLLVTSGTGQPGGGVSNFVLRGISTAVDPTLSSVRNPLIVVDGIPVTQDQFQLYIDTYRTPTTNPLSQLNPSDFESISVLKDAAAVALYGARASNGVIVITTKKGKSGKIQFNLRHQTDISSPLNGKVDVLSQQEYLDLLYETYKNTPNNPGWTDASIRTHLIGRFPTVVKQPGDTSFYPASDWFGEIFNDHATTMSNELSMSGGSEKNNFYLNLEYTKDNGVVRKTGYDRKSLRFNFESRPVNWLKLGLNTSLSYNVQNYGGGARGYDGPVIAAMSPLNPIRSLDGNLILNFTNGGADQSGSQFVNPVAALEYNINRNTSFRGLGKMYAEVSLLKNLKLTTNAGFDFMLAESKEKSDPRLFDPGSFSSGIGRIEEQDVRRGNIITTNLLQFSKGFNDHDVNVILGQEAQILTQKNLLVAVRNLELPYYDQISSPGVTVFRQSGAFTKETLMSFFGQGNYAYKSKYFVSASIRRDGSSRFGEDKRYGTYWSTGIGWLISSEKFMRATSNWLDYLKIRSSIGAAGNAAAINRFTRFDRLQNTIYLGGTAVFPTNEPGSENVQWENTFTWDAGLELRLFQQRIAITADIYTRKTTDLIYQTLLPDNTGYRAVLANIGEMENKGVELSLSADLVRNNKFQWNINVNWSTNENKLVKANVPLASLSGPVLGNEEGRNFNSFYLVRWAGVDPADGSPTWFDKDGKITKTYSSKDKVFVGKPQPDGFGGVKNTFSYQSFQLSALLYYQYGYELFISDNLVNDGRYPYMNQDRRALDRWQKPGDIAANPKRVLNNTNGGSVDRPSTRYLFEGDQIRLQNVSFSYNFSKHITDVLHLASLRVFAQGHNLHVFTDFPGQDPGNANVGGSIGLKYPNQRSFSFGLNAGF